MATSNRQNDSLLGQWFSNAYYDTAARKVRKQRLDRMNHAAERAADYVDNVPTNPLGDVTNAVFNTGTDVLGDVAGNGLEDLFGTLKTRSASGVGNAPKAVSAKSALAKAPWIGWSKKGGLDMFGHNIGKWSNIGNLVSNGIQAVGNVSELGNAQSATNDILDEIRLATMNNPYYQYDLSEDELRLIREIRRGTSDTAAGIDDIDFWNTLKNTGIGVATGAIGGIPGMVIGGVGGLLNSALTDVSTAQQATNAELEELLSALQASKQEYKAMRARRGRSAVI